MARRLTHRLFGLLAVGIISALAFDQIFQSSIFSLWQIRESTSFNTIIAIVTLIALVSCPILIAALWHWHVWHDRLWGLPAWGLVSPHLAILAIGVFVLPDIVGSAKAPATPNQITAYSEQPIILPGQDGPVGLAIAFEMLVPDPRQIWLYPPVIARRHDLEVGREDRLPGAGVFAGRLRFAPLSGIAYLSELSDGTAREPRLVFKWSGTNEPSIIELKLYPGIVAGIDASGAVCLKTRQLASQNGARLAFELAVRWTSADRTSGIGRPLADVMKARSAIWRDPELWTAMHRKASPERLRKAGYRSCDRPLSKRTRGTQCFCRG